ncbi:MAG: hypothetical protein WBX22_31655 [Silvibacterium sp.]
MQSSFRQSISALLLTCAVQFAVSQTVPLTNPAKEEAAQQVPQHFVCNTGYSAQQCHEQMSVLRPMLDKYGAGRLGDWTWVLVKSDDWKELQRKHRMDPDSPAFTVLDKRETFFEEALMSPIAPRRIELVTRWSSGMDDLLKLAVTHELGHALCNERNEWKADANGEQLRKGQPVQCK